MTEEKEFVEFSEDGDTCTVSINADMTIYTASKMKKEFLDKFSECLSNVIRRVELDMSGVSEMDTAGFQIILLSRKEAARTGASLYIVAQSNSVTEVMSTYRMTEYVKSPTNS